MSGALRKIVDALRYAFLEGGAIDLPALLLCEPMAHGQDLPSHWTQNLKGTDMPYVNIKVTREGAAADQKVALISGATDLLVGVLDKFPATTFVPIDEVALEDWGVGGLPAEQYRREAAG